MVEGLSRCHLPKHCQRRFGSPRAFHACCNLVGGLAVADRNALNELELEIIGVRPDKLCTLNIRLFGSPALAHYRHLHSVCMALGQACLLACFQGRKVHRCTTDIHALFKPLFQGVTDDKPDCLVRVESKVCFSGKTCHIQTARLNTHTCPDLLSDQPVTARQASQAKQTPILCIHQANKQQPVVSLACSCMLLHGLTWPHMPLHGICCAAYQSADWTRQS